jgi:hypothetical protein
VNIRFRGKPGCFQIRLTVASLTPGAFAIERVLQRVALGGWLWSVASTIAALGVAKGRDAARTRRVLLQAGAAKRQEPLLPQLHGRSRSAHLLGGPLALHARSRQQDDFRPLNDPQGLASRSGPSLQSDALLIAKKTPALLPAGF